MKKIQTRIKPEHASQLGLTIIPSGCYRITQEQYKELQVIRTKVILENNNDAPRDILTAYANDGRLMDIDEYCQFYNIPRETVKSYKMVSHTGTPYYNIQSTNITLQETDDFLIRLEEKISKHKPDYSKVKILPQSSKNLLILDIADLHIGKYANAYDTGENYNIEIAKQRAIEGVAGILEKSKNFNIDRVLFVIGNDILHIDNAKRTTTSGTPQDTDRNLYDMFNEGLDLYVRIIESLITTYNVDLVFNASNHDFMSGWMLSRTISAWFRNCPNVTIDDAISHRKYYQYGKNMIATTHGDGAKMQDLPLLMANEQPKMWSETIYRHCYCHHLHHKQVTKFQSAKDYIGVTVEYLRSPSSADRWHHTNGYTGAKKAIEGFIHNYEDGQIARISHYF